MIIPSSIRLADGEELEIRQEGEGLYAVENAYAGTLQEFFSGRSAPIVIAEEWPGTRDMAISGRLMVGDLPKKTVEPVDGVWLADGTWEADAVE